MPQPTAYTPTADFSVDEANGAGGRSTVNTAALDAELAAVAATLAGVRTNLALNQRDDGEIRDERVKLHTLAAEVKALLAASGATIRGAWVTATVYAVKDVATQGGNTYIAAIPHTAGTFATDLAAGKWVLLALGGTTAASVPFVSTATLAASNVQAAIEEADTENRAASAAAALAAANAATGLATLIADMASTSDATKGAALVGANPTANPTPGPTVANAIRSYASPLMFAGCPTDGVSDASSYVAAALAAGKREIIIPGGYTFVVDGNLTVPTGVRIRGEGTLKKKAGTIKHMLVLADGAQDVLIEGITLDGNRSAFSTGNAASAVVAYLAQGLVVRDLKLNNIIDCGLKLFNCGYVEVIGGRFYNIGENGIEFKNYDVDPRTNVAYVSALPALQGGHRIVGAWFGKIDNGTGDGSGDGCGILVSAGKLAAGTAYPVKGVTIEASHFLNVKRGVWAENNDAGCETEDMSVLGCWFRGDVASFGGDVKDGIGAINVKRFKAISNTIVNVGNMNVTLPGTSCAGIQVGGTATDVVELLNNTVIDNTGNANRMDYAINLAAGANITATGNRTEGGSDGTIQVNSANVSNLVCHSNPGATATYSWSETVSTHLTVSNLPATATTAVKPAGYSDAAEVTFPMPVRLVGMSVKLSGAITSGSVTFKPYTNSVSRSNLDITQADFASGTVATKNISTNNGVTVDAGQPIRVDAVSSSLNPTTIDAIVTLVFETSLKE